MDGTVWSWGLNDEGQLGNGGTSPQPDSMPIPGLTGVTAIAAGAFHNLALKTDGSVWAWGNNSYYQISTTSTPYYASPVQISQCPAAVSVATGLSHGLALTGDGTVWGWGSNSWGVLGGLGPYPTPPVQISEISDAATVFGGPFATFFIKTDGTAWGLGQNEAGTLGDGNYGLHHLIISSPVQVQVPAQTLSIASGSSHTLFLLPGKAPGDLDLDGTVDAADLGMFEACAGGGAIPPEPSDRMPASDRFGGRTFL